jgi:outer membrane protein assembly factor BamB
MIRCGQQAHSQREWRLPLLLLVISVLVTAVSCSGSGQEPAAQLDIPMTTGADVDPALWNQLVAELERVLAQEGTARRSAAAPVGFASRVPDLSTHHAAGETYFTWSYRQHGDYDLNGDVNVSDLTQVGVHFGKTTLDDDWQVAQLADGDNNGEVGVSDVTPIGQNFGGRVSGYELQVRQDAQSVFTTSSEHPFIPGDKLTGIYPEYSRVSASVLPGPEYRVLPYVDGDNGREYGVESNLLITKDNHAQWSTSRSNNHRDGLAVAAGPAAPGEIWELELEGGIFFQEIVTGLDGTLYAGTTDERSEVPDPDSRGFIYALDTDGNVKWRFKTKGGIYTTPATCRTGRVIVGDSGGIIYCLTPDGKQLWRHQLPGIFAFTSPLVDDTGNTFVLTHILSGELISASTLYKLLPDGTTDWSRTLNSSCLASPFLNSQAQPTVVDDAGELYSFDYAGVSTYNFMLPAPPAQSFLFQASVAIREYLLIYFTDNEMMRIHWEDDSQQGSAILGEQAVTAPSLANEFRTVFGSRMPAPDSSLRLNHYTAGIENWDLPISGHLISNIAIDSQDRMYYGSLLYYETGLTNGVYCVLPDQTTSWYYPTDEWGPLNITIADDNLLVCVLLRDLEGAGADTKLLGIRGE